jgi:hypothetical protein
VQQQVLQALAQVIQVQRFAQVGVGCSGSAAHAGAVVAVAHEDERQPLFTLLAHLAQQVEAIEPGEFAGSDDQVGLGCQRAQRLRPSAQTCRRASQRTLSSISLSMSRTKGRLGNQTRGMGSAALMATLLQCARSFAASTESSYNHSA